MADAGVREARFQINWLLLQPTPGGGYRWAATQPAASDGVVFSFFVGTRGTRTLDARWTSGGNRSSRATYAVVAANGDAVDTVRVDQTTGGGTWHTLGTWTFPVGWSRVVLLRKDVYERVQRIVREINERADWDDPAFDVYDRDVS